MSRKFLLLVAPFLFLLAGCTTVSNFDSMQMRPDGTYLVVIASESEIMDVTYDAIQSQFPSFGLNRLRAPAKGWEWTEDNTRTQGRVLLTKVTGEGKGNKRVTGWGIQMEITAPNDERRLGPWVIKSLAKAFDFAFEHRDVPEVYARNVVPAAETDAAASTNVVLAKSSGTGFFVSTDGYLITNHHVIADATRINVYASNGNIYRAKLVSSDPSNDVALLKVDAQVTPLRITPTNAIQKGAEVFTLGYPLPDIEGQEVKATFGRVNALSGIQGDIRYLQVDLPIQPGNSGGPLLADDGSVIGIASATLNQEYVIKTAGTVAQNVNYAVKSEYFMPLLKYAKVNLAQEKAVPGAIKNPSQFEQSVVHIVTSIGRHQEDTP